MKKTFVFSILGIAVCLLMALPLFAKKTMAPVAAEQPASAWKLEKSKAWVTGRVALDSGYAKSVTLTPPTLSFDKMYRADLAYLDENDGTFAFEVNLFCPAALALRYPDLSRAGRYTPCRIRLQRLYEKQ